MPPPQLRKRGGDPVPRDAEDSYGTYSYGPYDDDDPYAGSYAGSDSGGWGIGSFFGFGSGGGGGGGSDEYSSDGGLRGIQDNWGLDAAAAGGAGPRRKDKGKPVRSGRSAGTWSFFNSLLDDDGYSTGDYSYYTESDEDGRGGALSSSDDEGFARGAGIGGAGAGAAAGAGGRLSRFGGAGAAFGGKAKALVADTGQKVKDKVGGFRDNAEEYASSESEEEVDEQQVQADKDIAEKFFKVDGNKSKGRVLAFKTESQPTCSCVYALGRVFWRLFWLVVSLALVVIIVPDFTADMYAVPDHQDFATLDTALPVNVSLSRSFLYVVPDDPLSGRGAPSLQILLEGTLPRLHKCTSNDAAGGACSFGTANCTCSVKDRGLTCEASYFPDVPAQGSARLVVIGSAVDGAVKNDDFCQVRLSVPFNVTLPAMAAVIADDAGFVVGSRQDSRRITFGGSGLAVNGSTGIVSVNHAGGRSLAVFLREGRFESFAPYFSVADIDTPEYPIAVVTAEPADIHIRTNSGPVCVTGASVSARDAAGAEVDQSPYTPSSAAGLGSASSAAGATPAPAQSPPARVWTFPVPGVAQNASLVPGGVAWTPITTPPMVLRLSTNASEISVLANASASTGAVPSGGGLNVISSGARPASIRETDAASLRKLFYPRDDTVAHPDYDMIFVNITGGGAVPGDFVWASNRIFFVVNHGLLSTLSANLIQLKTLRISASLDPGFCPQALPPVNDEDAVIVALQKSISLREERWLGSPSEPVYAIEGVGNPHGYGRGSGSAAAVAAAAGGSGKTSLGDLLGPGLPRSSVPRLITVRQSGSDGTSSAATPEPKVELTPARNDPRLVRMVDQLVIFDDLLGPFSSGSKVGFRNGCSYVEMFVTTGEEVDTTELRWTRSTALVSIVALSILIAFALATTCTALFAVGVRRGLRSRRRDLKKSIGVLRGSGVIALANSVGVNEGQFAFMPFSAKVAAEEESHFGALQREIQKTIDDGSSAAGLATENPFTGEEKTGLEKREYKEARIKYGYLSSKQIEKAERKDGMDDEIMVKTSRIYFCDSHNSTHLNSPEIFCFETSVKYGVKDPRTVVDVLNAVLTQPFSRLPVSVADYKFLQPLWFKAVQKYSAEREGAEEGSGDLKVTRANKLSDTDEVALYIDEWMGFFGLVADFIDSMADFLQKLGSGGAVKRIGNLGDPDHIAKMQKKVAGVASRKFKSLESIKEAVKNAEKKTDLIKKVAGDVQILASNFSEVAKAVGIEIGGHLQRLTNEIHNFIGHCTELARENYVLKNRESSAHDGGRSGKKNKSRGGADPEQQLRNEFKAKSKGKDKAKMLARDDLFAGIAGDAGDSSDEVAKIVQAIIETEAESRNLQVAVVEQTQPFLTKTVESEKIAQSCLEEFEKWKKILETISSGVDGSQMIDIMSEINGLVAVTRTMFNKLETAIHGIFDSAVELRSAGKNFISNIQDADTHFSKMRIRVQTSLGNAGRAAEERGGDIFAAIQRNARRMMDEAKDSGGAQMDPVRAKVARLAREVMGEATSIARNFKLLRKEVKDATSGFTFAGKRVEDMTGGASAAEVALENAGAGRGSARGAAAGGDAAAGAAAGATMLSADDVMRSVLAQAMEVSRDGAKGSSVKEAHGSVNAVLKKLRAPVMEAFGFSEDPEDKDDVNGDSDEEDYDSDAEDERKERLDEIKREKELGPKARRARLFVMGLKQQLVGFLSNGLWVLAHIFVMGIPTFILFWAALSLRAKVLVDITGCETYDFPIRAVSMLAWAYFIVGLGELAFHWSLLSKRWRSVRLLYQKFFYGMLGLYSFVMFFFLSLVVCWMVLGLLIKPEEAISYVMGLVSVFGMIGTQVKRAKSLVERLSEAMHEEITAQLRRIRVTVTRQERTLFVKNSLMGLRLTSANIATAIFAMLTVMAIVLAFIYLGMSVFSEPGATQALFGSALSSLAGIAAIAKGRTTPEDQKKFDEKAVALVRTSIRAALEKVIDAMQALHRHVVGPITTEAHRIAAKAQAQAQEKLGQLDREAKRALKKGRTFVEEKVQLAKEQADALIRRGDELTQTMQKEAVAKANSVIAKGSQLVSEKSDEAMRAARQQAKAGASFVDEQVIAANGMIRLMLDEAADLRRDMAAGGPVLAKLIQKYGDMAASHAEDAQYAGRARATAMVEAAGKEEGGNGGGKKGKDSLKAFYTKDAEYRARAEAAVMFASGRSAYISERAESARALARREFREFKFGNERRATWERRAGATARLMAAGAKGKVMSPWFVPVAAAVGKSDAEEIVASVAVGDDGDGAGIDDSRKPKAERSAEEVIAGARASDRRRLDKVKELVNRVRSKDGSRKALLDFLELSSAWAAPPSATKQSSASVKGGASRSDLVAAATGESKLSMTLNDPEGKGPGEKVTVACGYAGALLGKLLEISDDLYITTSERALFPPRPEDPAANAPVVYSTAVKDFVGKAEEARVEAAKADGEKFVNSERDSWESAAKRLRKDKSENAVRLAMELLSARQSAKTVLLSTLNRDLPSKGDDQDETKKTGPPKTGGEIYQEVFAVAGDVAAGRVFAAKDYYSDARARRAKVAEAAAFSCARRAVRERKADTFIAETDAALAQESAKAGDLDIAGWNALIAEESRAVWLTKMPRKDMIEAAAAKAKARAEFAVRNQDLHVTSHGLNARIKANAILLMGQKYVDRKVNEAKRKAHAILADGVAYVERQVAEAEARALLVLERVRSINVMLPVFQLQKMHFAPQTSNAVNQSGFPEDPRGRALRGLGKAVWLALVKVQLFQLEVRSSDGSICIKGILPEAVVNVIKDVDAQINVEEQRGKIDERGYLDTPIEIAKDTIEEAKWEICCEALENNYRCKRHTNGISIIAWS